MNLAPNLVVFYGVWVIVGFAIIMLHELGHMGMYAWFGRKTTIRIRWFGFETGSGHDTFLLTPWQNIAVYFGGMWLGGLPILMIQAPLLTIAYAILCLGDLFGIFMMLAVPKEFMNRRYRDYIEAKLKQAEVR